MISARPCWYLQFFKKDPIFKYDWCLCSPHLAQSITRLSGDIEENLAPKCNSNQSFSICHWNLNSITAHNYLKISLFRAYISLHNFDVVCISETYLDSTTALNDENLAITGYNLLRADHASNSKRGGVCVYYKSSLALRLIDVHYLQECLIFEILIGGKSCTFISLYRSPSQSSDFFEELADNLQLSLDKISNQNHSLRLTWVTLILNLQVGINTIKQHTKALKSMP